MKRSLLIIGALVLLTGIVSGCFPEKRVVWSPDGKWAAVRGNDGLYLCDERGKLGELLLKDVGPVAWLPDSKQLVLTHWQPAERWEEVVPLLSNERRDAIEKAAPKLRAEILAHEGSWKEFNPRSVEGLSGGEALATMAYVREKLGTGLKEKLADQWEEWQKLRPSICALQVATITPAGDLEAGRTLARSIDTLMLPQVAPHGQAVAFFQALPGDSESLMVASLSASDVPAQVAEGVARFPDWSADGQYLVYAAAKGPKPHDDKELRLGTISRRQVCDSRGSVLPQFGDAEELAGIVFQDETRVRCLHDGRVLFATVELHLPSTAKDMPPRAALFAVDPERQPVVTRMIPRETESEIPDALALFEVSPDEKHVCIPGSDGRVVVLTLASGEVWPILASNDADHLRLPPTWRSDNEVCLTYVPGEPAHKGRAEVALAKLDWNDRKVTRQVLSEKWPESVVTEFLKDKPGEPTSQP